MFSAVGPFFSPTRKGKKTLWYNDAMYYHGTKKVYQTLCHMMKLSLTHAVDAIEREMHLIKMRVAV